MSDTKHGWVTPRADGARARCGGPEVCGTCQTEQMHQQMHESILGGVFGTAAEPGPECTGATQGWRDIATAPKDGTPVLLFARHVDAKASTRVVGAFNPDYGWIAQSYRGQSVARLVPSLWADLLPFPGAHPIPAGAVADEGAVKRLRDAIEGECGGNWISEKQAAAVLAHLGHAAPAAGDAQIARQLLPKLQSLLDRMANDPHTGTMFEADGDTLRDAMHLCRSVVVDAASQQGGE